jgi:c-di-GMP-binding flagellar brake protein YcgR
MEDMVDEKAANDDEKFMTQHPVAIAQVLNELAINKTTLNLSFNHGQEQGLTTVIGVSKDKKSVYLDKSLDAGFNKRLLASDMVVFSKTDGIKVRWSAKKLTEVKLTDGEALKMPLPKSLYRFQRREFFRSLTPVTHPVVCHIPYRNPTNNQDEKLEMVLVDASLGGIGTMVTDHLSSILELEKVFPHCAISLPTFGDIDTSLCVKHITETVMRNGSKKFRVGFQFVGLSREDERIVQKYVLQLEREALVQARGE